MVAGKRTGAAKSSRHTKKYWRKGTNVDDIVDSIHEAGREKATGGIVAGMKDDELFVVDREQNSQKIKVTKRQQAALDKITRAIDKEMVSLPFPKKTLQKPAKLPRGNAILKQKEVKKPQKKQTGKKQKETGKYDVWEADLQPKVNNLDNEKAAEHYLRYTKKKQPKAPPKSITSLLPAVQVPDAGASYNPEAGEYSDYVNRVVQEEQKLIDNEEKIRKGIEPQWETKATEQDLLMEMTEGLKMHPKYNEGDEEEEEDESKPEAKIDESAVPVVIDRLTKDQKKKKAKAAKLALEEKRRLAEKAKEIDSHNVYRTKQIHKELEEEEKEHEKNLREKRKQRVITKLTTRQRLGRGKFEDAEEPFLLEEELTGSLRQIKPQGHVLDDRMKSLQRRNVLPIGGEKAKRLKKSLKRKYVEKRSVKEVTKGSRVI